MKVFLGVLAIIGAFALLVASRWLLWNVRPSKLLAKRRSRDEAGP